MQTRRELLVDSMVAGLSVSLASPLPTSAAATLRKPDEFVDFDALGMAELLRNREISRAEAVEIVIRRIEALDPILNVMTTKAYDRARANAETIPLESIFAGWPTEDISGRTAASSSDSRLMTSAGRSTARPCAMQPHLAPS